jgi:hypothetical protein
MEAWLKWLIAAACGVVIVAGGAYLWGGYKSWREASEIDAEREAARNELFFMSGIKRGNDQGLTGFCTKLENNQFPNADKATSARLLRNCRSLGYL